LLDFGSLDTLMQKSTDVQEFKPKAKGDHKDDDEVCECVYVFVYVIYEDINLYNGMQITLVLQ